MWTHYHYTRPQLSNVPRLEHIREQVVEGVVYFPRPAELNDDLDCRPRMLRPSDAQVIAYGVRRGGALYPGKEKRPERAKRKKSMEHRRGNRVLLQELWARNIARYGVLSLSKGKTNAHLWDGYAAGGTGVCIEYNFEHIIDTGLVDWIFFDVEYSEIPAELNVLDFQTTDPARIAEFIRRSFRIKALRWAVEEEVRVVYKVGDLTPPKVSVPPRTIRALYLGPAISNEDRAVILGWDTKIPVYQAAIGSDGLFAFHVAVGVTKVVPLLSMVRAFDLGFV